MRWHTDKPIPSLRAIRRLQPVARVEMDRIDAPARIAYAKARAYFRNKIKARLRRKAQNEPDTSSD